MARKGLFGSWFCVLVVCFLVWPGLAQVPEPAQCLVSGIYNLVRLPESKDGESCRLNCFAEPDCHMAVVARPLTGPGQCLLVNCLNQSQYSYPRDPSAEIRVYPKTTTCNDLKKGAHEVAEERFRCYDLMNYSSCQSGVPRFFYNSTSFRCERFYGGCGSNRNTFDTQEGCEALCNEKFRCYRPMLYGACRLNMTKFFYNQSSQRCERFTFSGCGSNGNIFSTVDECEMLCGDVKDSTATVPTETTEEPESTETDSTDTVSEETAPTFVILAISILALVALVVVAIIQRCRRSQSPPPDSERRQLL
ncbi:papilin-like [Micropterus salmoides]|uniref:papilin-like n=1 Tax=Micropterus salmoides TaxID=27706 RepID=UPI0018EB31C4|nr:papilin-like [Micropterus salmoides]